MILLTLLWLQANPKKYLLLVHFFSMAENILEKSFNIDLKR